MIRISILRLKLDTAVRGVVSSRLSTNDKNLNSEIETVIALCNSENAVLYLPMIRISILRLKQRPRPVIKVDPQLLPMIRISILRLKQLLNRRCTKGLRIQLSYWSIKVCSVGRTISLTGR